MAPCCAKCCDGVSSAREPEEVLTQTGEGVGKDGFLEEVACK